MASSEQEPAPINTALDRIEAAMDRIAHAAQRARQARLDAADQTARLEVRHEILREKVGNALSTLDALIVRVQKS
ncbi:hypothetical protein [Novosphingobium humi]|uniref:DUF4164 family protein n=1 Tax=Novosphingobium humi TaxID=2282397 RepID=A0ABY7U184_9SPHN|nr:hypothetical protein [Novosphingobium humi]WCT78521.1 hypothetical protein PQ457_06045 [Novosphingobium humi]WJS97925.1 hypothetical protein NYQ05_12355 [Novosphingobium humi]